MKLTKKHKAAIKSYLRAVAAWVIKSYLQELKPNSGSSMKDQITRLESRVDDLFVLISKR